MTDATRLKLFNDLLEARPEIEKAIDGCRCDAFLETGAPIWACQLGLGKDPRIVAFRREAAKRLRATIFREDKTHRYLLAGEPHTYLIRPISYPVCAVILGLKDHVTLLRAVRGEEVAA